MKIIARAPVSDREYALASDHFHAGHGPGGADSFRQLAAVVVQQLPRNPALRALARANRQYLARPGRRSESWARGFIDQYVNGVGVETLFSQPVVAGYAPRVSGSPYDRQLGRSAGATGWMMLYCVEGGGVIDTGLRRVWMKPGDAALFEPGAVMSFARAPEHEVWGHYWVAFQAARHWQEWLDWPKVGPLVGYLRAEGGRQAELERAFALLLDNYSHAGAMKTELDHNLLEQIILRCRLLMPAGSQAQTDERVKKAQRFIEANFNRPFSVEQVAAAAAMSRSSLAHLFKQQTGATVLAWRDEQRMMHAARLLRSTALPVSRIAAECGYGDAAFFCRTFKRLLGYTPREYRKR
ncbi:arabinose operon transcriptional regulator AraC [Parahaliea mediterranea]|uniref:Arabinose operon transcriptional regulator AraC n=1 Tax=Parahaliea mediterranea TaxID=651086 RepID=A0A939IM04_9GAMM|nr:arabinose operon transcriptional regulator AraC [Parahaliea mediterranea]MBN7796502.1 arabinose operon transcriptional regulator AraC [Parahaliea mediterranea]